MGKKLKFTGSKLLGTELRRLRGHRSLEHIAALTRTTPLAERISPISAPALSQIETGTSFPSVETLHTLATIYQRPMQQLLDHVIQERVTGDLSLPDDHDAVRGLFREAFESGSWRRAMALAIRGEELAPSPTERVGWRANRAICLQQFGLRDDAIQILLSCTSDPDAPTARLYQVYRSLAEALASAGHLGVAAAVAGHALAMAPASLPPAWRWQLQSTRARLLLADNETRPQPDVAAVQEALRLVQGARENVPEDQPQARLLLAVQGAIARRLLGEIERAAFELESVRDEARRQDQKLAEVIACIALGRLRADQGRPEEAVAVLTEGEHVAVDEGFVDEAFESYYELHRVSRTQGDGRHDFYLRRCCRYYPLVQSKTPQVLAYEKIAREQG